MKQILISIFLLLSLFFTNHLIINAQEDETGLTYEESLQINQDVQNVDEIATLDETLIDTEAENTSASFSFFQVAFAVLAPITLITIGYLLIKKLKL